MTPALPIVALAASLAAQQAPPPMQLDVPSSAVDVKLVSTEGESERVDVVAYDAPAHEVLERIARATGRKFTLDPGETVIRAHGPVNVQLRNRPLREAVDWIAGTAGLYAEVSRKEVRCAADTPLALAPEEQLRRAIDAWRLALLREPNSAEAPRLRMQIGDAYYQRGEFAQAIEVWENELEKYAPGFADLPLVYFRSGFAHVRLGDETAAQAQWNAIAMQWPHHALVAASRLATVRSLRRQGHDEAANVVLQLVVDHIDAGLAPQDLIDAGELLDEGGDSRRAVAALEWALQSTADPDLEQRGLVALARAQGRREDWAGVVTTAQKFLSRHAHGDRAPDVYFALAQAHHGLGDPFTALVALRRAREVHPSDEIAGRCDVLEGTLYADCGLFDRAEPLLAKAGASDLPQVAVPALLAHVQLLRDAGQYEAATHVCERLASIAGHDVEAGVLLAELRLLQHNHALALQVVGKTLPRADDAQRARLVEIANQALRDAPQSAALDVLVAPAAPTPVAPNPATPAETRHEH
jgi:tetratricopeptide (TPR) repeat protein